MEWKENWGGAFFEGAEACSGYTAEDCRILPFPLYVGKAEWVSVPFAVDGVWTAMAQVEKEGKKSAILLNQDAFGAFETARWEVSLPISSPFIFNWEESLFIAGVKDSAGAIYGWEPGREPELLHEIALERDFAFCSVDAGAGLGADTLLDGRLRLRIFDRETMKILRERLVSGMDEHCRIVSVSGSRERVRALGYREEKGVISIFTFFIHPEYLHVTEPEWLAVTKESWKICGFSELLGGNLELLLVLSEPGKRWKCGVLEV